MFACTAWIKLTRSDCFNTDILNITSIKTIITCLPTKLLTFVWTLLFLGQNKCLTDRLTASMIPLAMGLQQHFESRVHYGHKISLFAEVQIFSSRRVVARAVFADVMFLTDFFSSFLGTHFLDKPWIIAFTVNTVYINL